MQKNPWMTLGIVLFVFGSLFVFLLGSSMISLFGDAPMHVKSHKSILHLTLDGVIMDGKKVLKPLIKYRKDDRIKAIVVSINSPGGVVGPSQEIYEELKRVREIYKKPIVVVSTGLMASGAYYAAVAADKIVVAPGTMVGSIGVIMEFVNLEKLYDWAKVQRYSITTGKYKDSGAEYRQMRDDEKQLFQDMIDDVWMQFRDAVAEGRNLQKSDVTKYADGRVFTGAKAIEYGLADELGTLEDAYQIAADLAGLGDDFEIFEPPKNRPSFFDLVMNEEEDTGVLSNKIEKTINSVLKTELANKPLYLMPGVWN